MKKARVTDLLQFHTKPDRFDYKMKTIIGENFLRVTLIAFSFVFSILSVSLIALGVIYSDQLWYIKTYIGSDFLRFPTILLVLGGLSVFMSFAGCYCARNSNRKVFIVYIVLLVCLLGLEVSVSVIAFSNIDKTMVNRTRSIMLDQLTNQGPKGQETFHELEDSLECCGIDGPDDYLQNDWFDPKNNYCCGLDDCLNAIEDDYSNVWNKDGCAVIVATETQRVAEEGAAVGTVFTILQILQIGCVALMIRLSVL